MCLLLSGGWDMGVMAGAPASLLDHDVASGMEASHSGAQREWYLGPDASPG